MGNESKVTYGSVAMRIGMLRQASSTLILEIH